MINEAANAAELPTQTSDSTAAADAADAADALAEDNADLRAALFGLKSELEMLQEQIRSLQSTSMEAAAARFLTELNSSASGNLLDNLIYSSRAIRDLEATGWIPEPIEVEGIVATVTMLSDHLGRLGVQPIFEVGSLTEIVMEDLAEVQYIGSEFASPTEHKLVRFRSPGWRYQGQQIARAQAVEIVPDSSQTKA